MNFLSQILALFRISSDSDLYEDVSFRMTFSNVVNFLLLVHSFLLGTYALFQEDTFLSSVNLAFCFFFLTYFVISFVAKDVTLLETIDKIAFFLYFLVVFITCGYHDVIGLTVTMYPFIAIILHGRRLGVIISFIQTLFFIGYYVSAVFVFNIDTANIYSLVEMCIIVLMQIFSIFVFYVAVRWLTGMVYEKNREVALLASELRVKGELIDRLTSVLHKPLKEIAETSSILSGERLSTLQTELVSLIRASSLNATNNLNAVIKAASLNILIVPSEEVRFNLYTLLSGLLKLYKRRDPTKRHVYSVGGSVPEEVIGNSIMTRQVLLNILDALENNIGLADRSLKVTVNREDIFDRDLVLHFTVTLGYDLRSDHRDLSPIEDKITEFFGLGVTRRIVESEGGTFAINTKVGSLSIEFSLKYKDAEALNALDPDLNNGDAVVFERASLLSNATVLFMTDNDMLWAQVGEALRKHIGALRRSVSLADTITQFSNTLIDVVITDLRTDGGSGAVLVHRLRNAESGIGRKVPILCFVDPEKPNEVREAASAAFDVNLQLPIDENVVRAMVGSFFM